MPIIKGAIKKLRADKMRSLRNQKVKSNLKSALKEARKKTSLEAVKKAISVLDKAVKKNLVHKNTAARKKSALMKKLFATKPKRVSKVVKKVKS